MPGAREGSVTLPRGIRSSTVVQVVSECGPDQTVSMAERGCNGRPGAGHRLCETEIGGFAIDTHPPGSRMLVAASAVLLAGVALHGADHALQERGALR
jgi:hypothetical protein